MRITWDLLATHHLVASSRWYYRTDNLHKKRNQQSMVPKDGGLRYNGDLACIELLFATSKVRFGKVKEL